MKGKVNVGKVELLTEAKMLKIDSKLTKYFKNHVNLEQTKAPQRCWNNREDGNKGTRFTVGTILVISLGFCCCFAIC
ncbi:hypothetical protein [Rickettsiales endosymbiont of Trichoplax sp. H2]|uniref:hypothetical protein n=1 Tax=Rickettsiales endosymbiont of Trichoplax sp. H2 TaxID=2021221 RepID=UPI0012B2611E|nr:hypothetical protein [Rickettsiales endosymbiont of Trichoplax sp. H2]MSO13644.1 hypothetical protein [Rickettsiales endosymbiont of Trichoplax sp. H2]